MLRISKTILISFALASGFGAGAADTARATNAATLIATDLQAGPGKDFTRIDRLPAGTALVNHGCVDKMKWCRIRAGGLRGWVAGGDLVRQTAPGASLYASYPRPTAGDMAGDGAGEFDEVEALDDRRLLYDPPRRRHAKHKRGKHGKYRRHPRDTFWTTKKRRFFVKTRRQFWTNVEFHGGKKIHRHKKNAKKRLRARKIRMKTSYTKSGFGLLIR